MSSLLFPLLLILYGECSEDKLIRVSARVMFYGYALSNLLFTILPPVDTTILWASLPYFVSYGYLAYIHKQVCSRLLLAGLALLQVINYLSLYFQSYTLFLTIPFYFEYSNIILRELHIFLITMCSSDFKVDTRLKILTLIFYFVEYSYITGF